jgi:hypothetical protein
MKTTMVVCLMFVCSGFLRAQQAKTPDAPAAKPEPMKLPDDFVKAAMEAINAVASMHGTVLDSQHADEAMDRASTIEDLEPDKNVRVNEMMVNAALLIFHIHTESVLTKLQINATNNLAEAYLQGGKAIVEAQVAKEIGVPNDPASDKIRSNYAACTEAMKDQLRERTLTGLPKTCGD